MSVLRFIAFSLEKLCKMKVSHHFGLMNYVIIMLGLRFYPENRRQRISNLIVFVFNLLIASYLASVALYKFSLNPSHLFNANYVSYNSQFMVILSTLSYKQKAIKEVYEHALRLCGRKTMERITKLSKLYFCFMSFASISTMLTFACYIDDRAIKKLMFSTSSKVSLIEKLFAYFIFIYYYPIVLFAGLHCSIFHYVQLVWSFHLIDRSYFHSVEKLIRGRVNYKEVLNKKTLIDEVKQHFEKRMNIFPFLWYTVLFENCCGIIWALQNFEKLEMSVQWSTVEMISYFMMLLTLLLVLFVIDYNLARYLEDNSMIATKLVKTSGEFNAEVEKTIDLLKNDGGIAFTGWGFFKLRKSFVLSFLGGLVTFSVLFKQMWQNTI